MKREEIKKIMIVYNDNDFIRVFDWIGKVVLMTIKNKTNICGEEILKESDNIEKFVKSLLPSAITFLQYREDRYDNYCRYVKYFENIKFKYNFDETDDDWIFGGSETLIIDVDKNESYIR